MQENKRSVKKKMLKALTLVGCFSTGIIYSSIGVIAILSFMKLKRGGADENSFFVLLDGFALGRVISWIIIIGAVCFVAWRFYEAYKDPYKVGNNAKGILIRTGAVFSSGADAFIAFSVLQALFSADKAPITGEPTQQRHMAAGLLTTESGRVLVYCLAVIILLTALVLLFYGFSKRFTETINTKKLKKGWVYAVHALAYLGYLSRGVILAITGFFFLKAAISRNGNYVVNTDKAFDFIGDHIGHFAFLFIAAGTICYGLYMFILGIYYDIDADETIE